MKDKQLINDILTISTAYGWEYFSLDPGSRSLSVVKSGKRINIYYTKMTVAICIPGKPQQFKKRVSMTELEKIFISI